jgi:hypothetical protein
MGSQETGKKSSMGTRIRMRQVRPAIESNAYDNPQAGPGYMLEVSSKSSAVC